MISKNKLKYIHSLEQKKARQREGVFVAEGTKIVSELLLAGFHPQCLIGTEEWFDTMQKSHSNDAEHILVSEEELRKASFLQHPQQVMGMVCQQSMSRPRRCAGPRKPRHYNTHSRLVWHSHYHLQSRDRGCLCSEGGASHYG